MITIHLPAHFLLVRHNPSQAIHMTTNRLQTHFLLVRRKILRLYFLQAAK